MPDILEPPTAPLPESPAAPTPTPPKQNDGESRVARFYARRVPEKPSPIPDTKPVAKPDGEASEKEKSKPIAKAKAAKPAPVVAPPPDFEAMGERIAVGVAKGIQPLIAKPAPVPDRTAALRFTERRDYEILKRLEETKPDTYKGRSELWLDQLDRQQKREDDFYAANPEGEYDPNSEENKAFTKKNSLDDVDADDFEAAQEDIREERLAKRVKKDIAPELEPIKARGRLESERPAIFGARVKAARTFLGMVGEEFTKALSPDGRISLEEGDKLVAANPANNIPLNLAGKVEVFADQMHRLARPDPLPALERPRDKRAPYVSPDEVMEIALKCEAAYKSLPAHLSEDEDGSMSTDGKRFATSDEYAAMTEAQQQRHWRLDAQKIIEMYAQSQAEIAKQEMQLREAELEAFAKAKGYVKNGNGSAAPAPVSEATLEPKPRPPSPPGTIAPNAAHEMTRTVAPNGSGNNGWLSSIYSRK